MANAQIVTTSVLLRDFRIPDGLGDSFEAEGYSEPASEEFCKSLGQKCPFSLVEYLLYDSVITKITTKFITDKYYKGLSVMLN
jgi:hypothetical protein